MALAKLKILDPSTYHLKFVGEFTGGLDNAMRAISYWTKPQLQLELF